MNIFIKTGLLFFTINVIGLVGISTASIFNDVFADQNKESEHSNTSENPSTTSPISIPDKPKEDKPKGECSPWDPRC
ncbi:MAG: hypothetical protein AB7P56_05880 [Nitrososphaeraceae archaeon]